MRSLTVGVLALQGDVSEHIEATKSAGTLLKIPITVISVRTADDLETLDALIIPGGESTTLQKLCEREGMFQKMKKVKNIFGTCAGAILLAKEVLHASEGQRTLGIMDIDVDRNAYGRQNESFEKVIDTEFGKMNAVFIRAPKIGRIGKKLKVLARNGNEIFACEERVGGRYYLATCFHPEYTSGVFHKYFLGQTLREVVG
ncbi:MAG: pyridoxal 5'-phosphate synthase glutaminase subunit PdxT [Candidatus Pacebacteria bacterium]|nr:pyridoxal 5'-phosphate synthase glutaminase subunit PdxT [Candidatus Paceibacterota bacterium]MBP9831907.1 pyridoxal 5'-phosphate synthase glutaminase subunit PdxT [Candidatus Paceibacterota bacterium]